MEHLVEEGWVDYTDQCEDIQKDEMSVVTTELAGKLCAPVDSSSEWPGE